MSIRLVDSVLCYFVLFVILFGIVAGNLGSNRNCILKTRKKYIIQSEAEINEEISAAGKALEERVDHEYVMTSRDGLELHGYLIRAGAGSDKYIFCCHSYNSRLAGFEFGETADIWISRGYNVFLVDHRAHGKSGGKFISFGQFESDDCIDWLNFMRKEFGENIEIALIGQSMGGSIVLMMSAKETLPDNVRCVISDCGYTCFYNTLWNLLPLPKWLRGPTLWPMNRYLDIFHHIDMKKSDALGAVKKARVPVLFLNGAKDSYVPLWMGDQLYEACAAEKERVIFPNATHIKNHAYYPEEYEKAVTGFAGKYLQA